eukprot:jgi/Botrbrau1/10043/Bobra.0355s0002.1
MYSSATHVDLEANTPIYRGLSPGILKVREVFSVREAFNGVNVLITGASTFVGSLAAAQLLAGCPTIGRVWLLVQSSERKTIVPQLANLIEQSIRNRRSTGVCPPLQALEAVEVLTGDLSLACCGLLPRIRRRLQLNVHVVIHADTCSDSALGIRALVEHNFEGTQNLMELVGGCLRLKAFVYLSCASACPMSHGFSQREERIVPLSDEEGNAVDCRRLASELQHLPAEFAGTRADECMRFWKLGGAAALAHALTETELDRISCSSFPLAIVRPSAIGAAAFWPSLGFLPGNGDVPSAAPLLLSAQSGHSGKDSRDVVDIIPADVVAASLVSTAGFLMQYPWKGQPVVVNASSAGTFPLTQGHLQASLSSSGPRRPSAASCGLACMAAPAVLPGADGGDLEAHSPISPRQPENSKSGMSAPRSRSGWSLMACTGSRDWAADDGAESVRSLDGTASLASVATGGTGSDHSAWGGAKSLLTSGVWQPLRRAPSVVRHLSLPSCVAKAAVAGAVKDEDFPIIPITEVLPRLAAALPDDEVADFPLAWNSETCRWTTYLASFLRSLNERHKHTL